MPSYHPDADKEFDHLLSAGSLDIKKALGMFIQRHHRIEDGSEPLSAHELLPNSGPSLQLMHAVAYSVGLAEVLAIYETTSAGIKALTFDGWDRFIRVGPPGVTGDARTRAWSRAS